MKVGKLAKTAVTDHHRAKRLHARTALRDAASYLQRQDPRDLASNVTTVYHTMEHAGRGLGLWARK